MKHFTQILGNVGSEPEMRYTPSGQAVTNFSVAVNERYTSANGEKVKRTIWYRVSTWGKQAEVCKQYVKKGMLVLVDGRLTADEHGNPRVWTDDKGVAHSNFELRASDVTFLSRVEAGQPSEPGVPAPEDDIPF